MGEHKTFWGRFGDAAITAVVTLALLVGLAYVLGGPQRDAAADERVKVVLLEIERHRYVNDCLLYAGLERALPDLQRCLDESLELQPGDSAEELLRRNLLERS